jgi:hypothetical protein
MLPHALCDRTNPQSDALASAMPTRESAISLARVSGEFLAPVGVL